MITIKLQGGLGNQLFQYATALSLAHYHGTDMAFDLSFFQNLKYNAIVTPRSFSLGAFGLAPVQPPLTDRLAYGLTNLPYRKRIQQLVRRWYPVTMYREHSFRYDPSIVYSTSKNTHLTGYFQSELYFKKIEKLIRNKLIFQTEGDMTKAIRTTNSVSIHIRRGDYASNPTARQYHGLCSLRYYEAAAAYVAERRNNIHLYVFSDDQAWVRKHLLLPYPITFVEGNAGTNSYKDMQLMSQCKHNIIANSSFSWWGAWLNQNPDKIVIAPKQWFNDINAQKEASDLLPKSWIKL